MANQNQNGRNVALPDENRPSWRPQDQSMRGRGDDDRGRSWRDRDDRDDDRYMSDRGRFGSSREARWDDDRDEGYRRSERYGQGQSGYGAGRFGSYEDRQHGEGADDRFSGRAGQGYWQDRGTISQRDYHSGYNQGSVGFGGYGSSEQSRFQGGAQGFGEQGYPQGRSGGYGQEGEIYGGRGQWQQGRGPDQPGYGPQGSRDDGSPGHGVQRAQSGQLGSQWGFGQDEPQRQRGLHRGKGPQGYQRSDERIRELVCEALTDDDNIDASTIEVAVKSGEVILSGTAPDRMTKRLAEDVAERCSGVKDVQNQIKVTSEPQRGNQASNGVVARTEGEGPSDRKHRA